MTENISSLEVTTEGIKQTVTQIEGDMGKRNYCTDAPFLYTITNDKRKDGKLTISPDFFTDVNKKIASGETNQFSFGIDLTLTDYVAVSGFECGLIVSVTFDDGTSKWGSVKKESNFDGRMSFSMYAEWNTQITSINTYVRSYYTNATFQNAQLEIGAPTPYVKSLDILSSEISQTAENINLNITDGLKNTGIDITTGKIDMNADKVTFKESDETATRYIQINAENQRLIMVDSAGTEVMRIGFSDNTDATLGGTIRISKAGYDTIINNKGIEITSGSTKLELAGNGLRYYNGVSNLMSISSNSAGQMILGSTNWAISASEVGAGQVYKDSNGYLKVK